MRLCYIGIPLLILAGCATSAKNGSTTPGMARVDTLVIDLAAAPLDSVEVRVEPGVYVVTVRSLAPARTYSVSTGVATVPIPPFESLESEGAADSMALAPDSCSVTEEALGELSEESDEAAVPAHVARIRRLIAGCAALQDEAEWRIGETTLTSRPMTVRKGEVLSFRIERNGTPSRRWVRTYNGGDRGGWRQTYGFTFIGDALYPNRHHFVEEGETEGTYLIRSRRSRDVLRPAPSLFYTWMPADDEVRDWSWSPTVGIGFDLKAPVVSVGGSVTYNQNLSLGAGLSLHQVQRLSDRYEIGQQVNEVLSESELERSVYRVNPFIAVSIRSLSNPFDRSSDEQQ